MLFNPSLKKRLWNLLLTLLHWNAFLRKWRWCTHCRPNMNSRVIILIIVKCTFSDYQCGKHYTKDICYEYLDYQYSHHPTNIYLAVWNQIPQSRMLLVPGNTPPRDPPRLLSPSQPASAPSNQAHPRPFRHSVWPEPEHLPAPCTLQAV